MQAIKTVLDSKEVTEAISDSNHDPASAECWRCLGVGTRLRIAGTNQYIALNANLNEKPYTGQVFAETCLCLRRKLIRAQLEIVPPRFGVPRLRRLEPRHDLHASQAAAIAKIKQDPNDSYLLTGKNHTGKTHLGWAIYREALAQRRPAVACTVRDLLAEYRRVEIGVPDGETLKSPRVTAENLRKSGKPWLLFFDEFEKARPTEFASEQLFNVLDAANAFGHQLVITSNLNPDGLRSHWSRIDEIWGNSIMTRLQNCHEVSFF